MTAQDSAIQRIKAWIAAKTKQLDDESPELPGGFSYQERRVIDDGGDYGQQHEPEIERGWKHLITLRRGGDADGSRT